MKKTTKKKRQVFYLGATIDAASGAEGIGLMHSQSIQVPGTELKKTFLTLARSLSQQPPHQDEDEDQDIPASPPLLKRRRLSPPPMMSPPAPIMIPCYAKRRMHILREQMNEIKLTSPRSL